eukprot:CAMPEP_0196593932 /NCGR_PEP_ID=MMETSP1081-20130531/76951_1 /TAXON_ID=36882 /ORGANISM="Pyramimonas amylifera, Strain CCMP720" /LENGTH=209 /DNA_ID=CAMNT_0041918059 /DNA_START=24 /DNA_END=653 /DNA_ORIENTATION=-
MAKRMKHSDSSPGFTPLGDQGPDYGLGFEHSTPSKRLGGFKLKSKKTPLSPQDSQGTQEKVGASPGTSGATRLRMRQTEGGGQVELNNVLSEGVLGPLLKTQAFWPFFKPIRVGGKLGIVDYLLKVKIPVCLNDMKVRCNAIGYESVESFEDDIGRIRANAYAYNNPSNIGTFGDPALLPLADQFQAAALELILANKPSLDAAERLATG